MENKELNIFQRMAKITEHINKVAKNLKVDVTKTSSYKAVSEADVLEAVKPVEIEYGVYSYPVDRQVIETNVLTTVSEYQGNKTERNQLMMRLEVTYRFVNIDRPDEYIDMKTYGDGIDSGDKATGKAMTYADKYALLKAYKIQTGEDLDKDKSEELKGVKSGKTNTKTTVQKEEEKPKVRDYKQEVIDKLNELKINVNEYAKEHKLSKATTQEEAKQILEELCKM